MRFTTLFVLALCCGAAAGSALANQVGNAGFEDPILYDQPMTPTGNWTAFFGPGGTQFVAVVGDHPHSGAQNLSTSLSGFANGFNGVVQRVNGTVTPGVAYEFSFFARATGPVLDAAEYRIQWLNAAGGYIGDQFALTQQIGNLLTDEYQPFSYTGIAPPEAMFAELVFAVQSFGGGGLDTNVAWDDVSFVPPPGSGVLLCLAGVGMLRRRRA